MKKSIVPIKEVVFDKDLYPRNAYSQRQAWIYSEEMRSGVEFPPIVLVRVKGKKGLILIDGKHRLEARKILNETHISVETQPNVLNEIEAFKLAIKLNINHGMKMTSFDKTKAILKLRKFGYKDAETAKIIQIPIDKIEKFVADRIVMTLKGEPMAIKALIGHKAGEQVDDFELDNIQKPFTSGSQVKILDEIITLIKNDLINLEDAKVARKLKSLYRALTKMFNGGRK